MPDTMSKLLASAALGLCLAAPAHAEQNFTCQLTDTDTVAKVWIGQRPLSLMWSGADGAPESVFSAEIDAKTILFYGNSLFMGTSGHLMAEKVSGAIDRKTGQLFWGKLVGQCKGVK